MQTYSDSLITAMANRGILISRVPMRDKRLLIACLFLTFETLREHRNMTGQISGEIFRVIRFYFMFQIYLRHPIFS